MKLNFKSNFDPDPPNIPKVHTDKLDALKDGDLYESRDIDKLFRSAAARRMSREFREAGYCAGLSTGKCIKKLWWGNKRTIAEFKKEFKIE